MSLRTSAQCEALDERLQRKLHAAILEAEQLEERALLILLELEKEGV